MDKCDVQTNSDAGFGTKVKGGEILGDPKTWHVPFQTFEDARIGVEYGLPECAQGSLLLVIQRRELCLNVNLGCSTAWFGGPPLPGMNP